MISMVSPAKLKVYIVSSCCSETFTAGERVCSVSCSTLGDRRVVYTHHGVDDAPRVGIACHLLFGFFAAMFPLIASYEYVRGHIRTYYEYLSADIFSVRSAIYPTWHADRWRITERRSIGDSFSFT